MKGQEITYPVERSSAQISENDKGTRKTGKSEGYESGVKKTTFHHA